MSGTTPFSHRAVMVEEVVELFRTVPGGVVVDATVGGGGHAAAVLHAHPHLRLVGLDRDTDALDAAQAALRGFGDRVTLRHARFDRLATTLQELSDAATPDFGRSEFGRSVSGVLFDLGVSSPQLDRPERGFSYREDAPLDMRMDRSSGSTAGDFLATVDGRELARVLREYGGERFAGRVAAAIVAARPLRTTGELVDVIKSAIPAPARRRGGHPAKRTFQAIRIAVNGELEVLPAALEQAIDVLVPGGRCVVLAYHSGEDRIVKDTFVRASTGDCTCPPGMPCVCGATPVVRLIRRGATKPSGAEVAVNPRAESARLRAAEKLAPDDGPEDAA